MYNIREKNHFNSKSRVVSRRESYHTLFPASQFHDYFRATRKATSRPYGYGPSSKRSSFTSAASCNVTPERSYFWDCSSFYSSPWDSKTPKWRTIWRSSGSKVRRDNNIISLHIFPYIFFIVEGRMIGCCGCYPIVDLSLGVKMSVFPSAELPPWRQMTLLRNQSLPICDISKLRTSPPSGGSNAAERKTLQG